MNELVGDYDEPDTISGITLDLLVLFGTFLLSGRPHLRLGVHHNVGFDYLPAVLIEDSDVVP